MICSGPQAAVPARGCGGCSSAHSEAVPTGSCPIQGPGSTQTAGGQARCVCVGEWGGGGGMWEGVGWTIGEC